MYKECEQDDDNVFIMENENTTYDETLTTPDELSFPWFLIKAIQKTRNLHPPDYTRLKQVNISYYAQLLFISIMFVVAIIIGAIFLDRCQTERMICIFLIIHGSVGGAIAVVHITAAIVK